MISHIAHYSTYSTLRQLLKWQKKSQVVLTFSKTTPFNDTVTGIENSGHSQANDWQIADGISYLKESYNVHGCPDPWFSSTTFYRSKKFEIFVLENTLMWTVSSQFFLQMLVLGILGKMSGLQSVRTVTKVRCTSCYQGQMYGLSPRSDVRIVTKVRCTNCHQGQMYVLSPRSDVRIVTKVRCTNCHQGQMYELSPRTDVRTVTKDRCTNCYQGQMYEMSPRTDVRNVTKGRCTNCQQGQMQHVEISSCSSSEKQTRRGCCSAIVRL